MTVYPSAKGSVGLYGWREACNDKEVTTQIIIVCEPRMSLRRARAVPERLMVGMLKEVNVRPRSERIIALQNGFGGVSSRAEKNRSFNKGITSVHERVIGKGMLATSH